MTKRLLLVLATLLLATSAHATTYYVNPAGDGTTGLSDAHAFTSIAQVNAKTFATGDDVYFKCGNTWSSATLTIDWNGTSSNRVIVGAYHMDGANYVYDAVGQNKPVISGNSQAYPPSSGDGDIYLPIVDIVGNYVTLVNLEIKQSRQRGVRVYSKDYVTISNCYIHGHYSTAVYLHTGSDYNLIEGCEIYNNNYGAWNEPGNWPVGGLFVWQSTFCTMRGNTVHHNWGEPASDYNHCSDTTYEYNVFYDNWATNGMYSSCSRNVIIRYNLVYGTVNNILRYGHMPSGIVFSDESFCASTSYNNNFEIYGNFVANCGSGIDYWGGALAAKTGVKVYNNTLIEMRDPGGATPVGIKLGESMASDAEFKNNIVWQTTGTMANVQSTVDSDYNLWTSTPTDTDAIGLHDPAHGEPTLAKMTGWTSPAAGSLYDDDFKKVLGSRGIDTGLALDATSEYLYDAFGTLRPQNLLWDIGADEYVLTGPDVTPPTVSITYPTSGLSVAGTITLTATATDNVGVVGVQFKIDGANVGSEDTLSPYSLSWNSLSVANGSHTVSATARDAAGNSTTSTAITFTVANDVAAPVVTVTVPTESAELSGDSATITITATDAVGVIGVRVIIDGAYYGAEDLTSPYGWTWNTLTTNNGAHTIVGVARDAAGNLGYSATRNVTVLNALSTVVIIRADGAFSAQ